MGYRVNLTDNTTTSFLLWMKRKQQTQLEPRPVTSICSTVTQSSKLNRFSSPTADRLVTDSTPSVNCRSTVGTLSVNKLYLTSLLSHPFATPVRKAAGQTVHDHCSCESLALASGYRSGRAHFPLNSRSLGEMSVFYRRGMYVPTVRTGFRGKGGRDENPD